MVISKNYDILHTLTRLGGGMLGGGACSIACSGGNCCSG